MSAVAHLVDWVRSEALPVWAERGFDARAGRFHERLDGAGRPLPVPHRAMVQARQIYVYAHAGQLGWHADGATLAARAMAALRRDFAVEANGEAAVRFSIDATTGQPRSELRDAYAHAFVLFAAAFLHQATGDRQVLDFGRRVAAYVDRVLADPRHGGHITDAEAGGAEKLQNPQMHLLEAWLALAEADPAGPWLERAGALVTLFRERLLRGGILAERFAEDWMPHPDGQVADVWEPGHHFEWIWLLDWYQRLTGDDLSEPRAALLRAATRAEASAGGLILDQLGADGRVVRTAHRLWPHCEAIKAATVVVDDRLAAEAAAGLADHFLGRPFAGGWTDQLDANRAPIFDYVPASSLYHLMLAAAVADGAVA